MLFQKAETTKEELDEGKQERKTKQKTQQTKSKENDNQQPKTTATIPPKKIKKI